MNIKEKQKELKVKQKKANCTVTNNKNQLYSIKTIPISIKCLMLKGVNKMTSDKIKIFRNMFFGSNTPLEAKPIETDAYKNAWRDIEEIQNKLEEENNKYIDKLLSCFGIADDERAFYSFIQGIEVGRLLYSKQ